MTTVVSNLWLFYEHDLVEYMTTQITVRSLSNETKIYFCKRLCPVKWQETEIKQSIFIPQSFQPLIISTPNHFNPCGEVTIKQTYLEETSTPAHSPAIFDLCLVRNVSTVAYIWPSRIRLIVGQQSPRIQRVQTESLQWSASLPTDTVSTIRLFFCIATLSNVSWVLSPFSNLSEAFCIKIGYEKAGKQVRCCSERLNREIK